MRRFTAPLFLAASLLLPALAQAQTSDTSSTKDAAHDTANSAKSTAHDAANTTKDAARDTKNAAKDTASDTKNAAKDATSDMSKSAKSSTSTTTTTTTTSMANLSQSDKDFVNEAAQGGMAEVKLGELAKTKAQSSAVKQFADKMVTDHSKANDALKSVAAKKGITLPADLSSDDQKKYDDLSKLSGAEFDKAYMDEMVKDHDKDVKMFQKAAKSSKDKDIKNFANKTLPTLKSHDKMAHSDSSHMKHM